MKTVRNRRSSVNQRIKRVVKILQGSLVHKRAVGECQDIGDVGVAGKRLDREELLHSARTIGPRRHLCQRTANQRIQKTCSSVLQVVETIT
ncbi:hypothetical protein HZA87_01550 [Candidatus Uhrbacteria bacterium]|nr:hypothetical protein [Candidatus Uhrbacteria bacterium]